VISTARQSLSGLLCSTSSQNHSDAARKQVSPNQSHHRNRHWAKSLTEHRHHGVERHHLPSFCAPLHPAVCAVEADVEKLDAGSKIVAFPTIKIESPKIESPKRC
jgi:ubiquinone biosynthesis protein UbiJ